MATARAVVVITGMGIDPEPPLVGSDECLNKAAGEALTIKKVPHRPGTAPALGLRAGWVAVAIITRTTSLKEILPC